MKKTINMIFENCTIDGGVIIENAKDCAYEFRVEDVFKQLDGEDGLTITIKKATKIGDLNVSA